MGINYKLEVIKMSHLPNLIYRFDIILIKIQTLCMCTSLCSTSTKIYMGRYKWKGLSLTKTFLKKKKWVESICSTEYELWL